MDPARTLLQILATLAVVLAPFAAGIGYGFFERHHAPLHRRTIWIAATLAAGAWLYLLYAAAGQIKARVYDVPFDGYSWIGLAAAVLVDAGFIALMLAERARRRQGVTHGPRVLGFRRNRRDCAQRPRGRGGAGP